MNFNVPNVSPDPEASEVAVGNVYGCKGGGKTKYWIIIGIGGRMASAIGINGDGVITSATAYGIHAFENRTLLGRVENLDKLSFDIVWEGQP